MTMEIEREVEFDFEDPTELNVGPVVGRSKGTVDPRACQCDWPSMALAKGTVGPYEHQSVYCENCGYRFFDVIEPIDGDDFTEEAEVSDTQ